MVKLKIKFSTIDDVKEFVSITENQKFDVDITSGRQVVDAKSLLGIISIISNDNMWIVINAEDSECESYLNLIRKYLV